MWSHRRSFHDVPPDRLLPAALAEVQQVIHHHLADQVVSGETVEVIDGEVKLARVKLGQRDTELECLVKHWVQGLPVHLPSMETEGRVKKKKRRRGKVE